MQQVDAHFSAGLALCFAKDQPNYATLKRRVAEHLYSCTDAVGDTPAHSISFAGLGTFMRNAWLQIDSSKPYPVGSLRAFFAKDDCFKVEPSQYAGGGYILRLSLHTVTATVSRPAASEPRPAQVCLHAGHEVSMPSAAVHACLPFVQLRTLYIVCGSSLGFAVRSCMPWTRIHPLHLLLAAHRSCTVHMRCAFGPGRVLS